MRYSRLLQCCLLVTLLLVTLLPRPGVAAITATPLFEGATSADGTAYIGPPLTPAANSLVLAWVTNTRATAPTIPTFSGNGLTWVQVATVTWGSSGAPTARTTLFRAMGPAPATGQNTMDFAGTTQTGLALSMIQFNNVDTTGSNGANAVVQSVTGRTDNASAAAGLSLTLAALGNVANASVGGFSNFINSATSISPGVGYTASSGTTYSPPTISLRAQWRATGNTTVNVTQSGTSHIGGIAVELKADLCSGNVVTTTASGGDGSLRECINKANLNPGTTITFNITAAANQSAGGDSWWRITPTTALPAITAANTVIDATTQTSNRGNTNTLGPEIELNGAAAGAGGWDGFGVVSPATGVTIHGFIINQWSGSGVSLWSGSGTVRGSYIGTNYAGTSAMANASYGLYLNTSGNTIGGTSTADRNVIAGNGGPGLYIVGNSNTVQGNYIGTSATAGATIANSGHGIQLLSGATGSTIGGTAAGAGNVIAGNGADGINHSATGGNTVQGNYIGTNASSATLPNSGHGIAISAGTLNIGNAAESQSNIIGPNSGAGINLTGGTVNLAGSVTVRGNMALTGGTLAMGSATLNLSGHWSRTGTTVTAGTSTVVLNGTSQNISGSTTFFNLTKTVATTDTLFFSAGSTTTVTGSVTLQGASGQPLRLLSLTPGSRWNFSIGSSTTTSFGFLNVTDSDASGSAAAKKPLIIQPSSSTDSGNNIDWFGLPSISVVKSSTLISDPVNGSTSPLHIPGAILNYQILTTNSGNGSPDTNTVVVTDALDSSKLEFDVATGITFTANTSGLTLGTVSYAHTATPTTYTYTPTGPYDANVAGIRITTSGTFASAGASFTLNFRVRIK